MKKSYDLWLYIPPIIITIIICIISGTPVAVISILLVFPIWGFSQAYISDRYSFHNDKRKKLSEVLNGLNINKKEWVKFSDLDKERYRKYYLKQENIKKEIVRKRYWEKNPKHLYKYKFAEEIIKKGVEKEWDNLSLQQRIEIIEKDELIKQEEKKKRDEERKMIDEKIKKHRLEMEKIHQSPEYVENQKWYESYKKEKKEREKQKQERAERLKIEEKEKKEAKQREEQKKLDEIKKKKLIEERKKQEQERYKEFYKRQLREKEERRNLQSEAIEEMIESGEIDGDNSSDRKRTIPSNVKEIVYVRDKGCCVACGSNENIEFDHIIPFSKGGSNSVNNIQLLCLKCNRNKSNKIM